MFTFIVIQFIRMSPSTSPVNRLEGCEMHKSNPQMLKLFPVLLIFVLTEKGGRWFFVNLRQYDCLNISYPNQFNFLEAF